MNKTLKPKDEDLNAECKERDKKHNEYFNGMLNAGNGADIEFLNLCGTIFPANVLPMNSIKLYFTNSKKTIENEFRINPKDLQKEKLSSVKYDFNLQLIGLDVFHEPFAILFLEKPSALLLRNSI